MKRIIQSVACAAALLVLAACGGGSDDAAGIGRLTAENLTPLNGSDSIIGTWIGAADFTETATSGEEVETFTGSRMFVMQIIDNGTGGYEAEDCSGESSTVDYDSEVNTVTVLNRDLIVTDFNKMSGTSSISSSGYNVRKWAFGESVVAEEDWTWVKVSNVTGNIGTIDAKYSSSSAGVTPITSELLALCRESVSYSNNLGDSWTSIRDSGSFEYQGSSRSFLFQNDSDGFAEVKISMLGINHDNDPGTIAMNIQNSTAEQYKVAYKSSGDISTYGAYTFDATLTVSTSE